MLSLILKAWLFTFHRFSPHLRKKKKDFRLTFIPCCMYARLFIHWVFYGSALLVQDKGNTKCEKHVSCLTSDWAVVFFESPIQPGLLPCHCCEICVLWKQAISKQLFRGVFLKAQVNTWGRHNPMFQNAWHDFKQKKIKSSDFPTGKQHSLCQCFFCFLFWMDAVFCFCRYHWIEWIKTPYISVRRVFHFSVSWAQCLFCICGRLSQNLWNNYLGFFLKFAGKKC